MSSGSGDWQFGMPGNSINMHELFRDAQILARLISKMIEPYEPQQAVP
jgi:predicted component of type VI protein secretion system